MHAPCVLWVLVASKLCGLMKCIICNSNNRICQECPIAYVIHYALRFIEEGWTNLYSGLGCAKLLVS